LVRSEVGSAYLLPARIDGYPARLIPDTEPAWRLILARGVGATGLFGFLKSETIHGGRGLSAMAFSPFKFLQEVRSETAKVTWPSRRETMITTLMVFVMVALASVFFFVADQVIRVLVTFVLGIH
jgi:preprotein translocase subunit SecE